jgi:rhodanese-related sulfurtransferase
MQEVPERLVEIHRDRPVIVYCHTGTRSAMVAGFLEHLGYGTSRTSTVGSTPGRVT